MIRCIKCVAVFWQKFSCVPISQKAGCSCGFSASKKKAVSLSLFLHDSWCEVHETTAMQNLLSLSNPSLPTSDILGREGLPLHVIICYTPKKKTTTIYNFSKSSLAVMCCTAALIQTHSFPIHFLHIQMVVGCSTNSSLLTTVVVTAHNTEQEEYLLHELVG